MKRPSVFSKRTTALDLLVVFASLAVATVARWLIDPALGGRLPYVTYFAVIFYIAWRCSLGPAIAALFIGWWAADFFFIEPRYVWWPHGETTADYVGTVMYFMVGGTSVAICAAMRLARNQAAEQAERLGTTLASIGDAVISTDTEGRITNFNRVAESLTGWSRDEALGQPLERVFRIVNEETRQPVDNPAARALEMGIIVGLANHTVLIAKDGSERPIDDSAAPIFCRDGQIVGCVLVFRDVTERRRTELAEAEHRRLLAMRVSVGEALATESRSREALRKCTQAIVDQLDAAFARIWTVDESGDVLELQASAGIYTHLDGPHSRIRIGEYKIGRIAQSRQPHLTNDVAHDPNISNPQWAQREGMVSFAGYPLVLGDQVLGVVALFARHPLSQVVLDELAPLARGISQYLQRKRNEDSLHRSEALHRILSELTADYGLICRIEDGGHVVIDSVTDGFAKVTGYTLAEMEAAGGWQMAVHPDDLSLIGDSIQRWLAGESHADEARIVTKSGDVRIIEYFGRVDRLHDEDVTRVYIAGQDVTEKKQAAEELRRQREWLRVTLGSIGDAVIATDTEGRVTFLNRVAQNITGWSPEEALGQPLESVFPIRDEQSRQPIQNPVERVLREGVIVGLANHTILVSRNGTERPIDDSAAPILDPSGATIGVVLIFRDVSEQRAAQQRLRQSEERFRSLVVASSQIVWTADPTGRIEQDSPSWRSFTGQTFEEWKDFGWLNAIHPEDRERTERVWRQSVAEKRICDTRYRVRAADGAYRLMTVRAVPLLNADGSIREWVGMNTDITERFLAEERERELLANSAEVNAKFRAFFDQGPLFAGVMALDGTLLEANRLSLDACGYKREQVIGKPFWECPWWSPSDELIDRIRSASAQAAAGEMFRTEMPYYIADGRRRIVDIVILPIKDESGRALFIAPTGTDVTERKRAEMLLDAQKQSLEMVVSGTPLCDVLTYLTRIVEELAEVDATASIMLKDQDGRLHVAAAPSLPDDYNAAVEGIEADSNVGTCAATAATGQVTITPNLETDPRWQKLKHLPLGLGLKAAWSTPIAARDGRVLGTFGTYFKSAREPSRFERQTVDILAQTAALAIERSQAEEDRLEADRRKDEFLATLAHELRNPLAPLRNALALLKLTGPAPESFAETLEMMDRQMTQMVRLIDDLLDVSRISRGKIELRKSRIELASIIHQAVEACRPLPEAENCVISVNLPQAPIYLDADPLRLAQIFTNLLNNACKFSDCGGQVTISAEQQESDVLVTVADDGIGIPQDKLDRIFDMFLQVDQSLVRTRGGLGIGLTLVKRLVEMHGGQVEARSDGVGHGSQFLVRLPIKVGLPQAPSEAMSGEMRSTPPRRILVVDDNHDAATSLARLLTLHGHQVETAHDGLEAIAAAERFAPGMILLDIGLPNLNGYDAARRIREQAWGKAITLVALTGWGQEEDRRKSREAGFDSHLVKPIEYSTLVTLLENCDGSASPEISRVGSIAAGPSGSGSN